MNLNDVDLVVLAKAGRDDRAFTELVNRHQAPLRSFLTRLCADPSLADDVAQSSFMKAHAAIATFKSGRSFRSWLYAIAYREFLQVRRKDAAAKRIKDALTTDALAADQTNTVSNDMSIDLQRALYTLSEPERASILICDAVGLSHGEASNALNLPLGSVKTYVARARSKMRMALEAPSPQPARTEEPTATTPPKPNGVHYAI